MASSEAQPTRSPVRPNWMVAFLENVLLNVFGCLVFSVGIWGAAIAIPGPAEWLIAHDAPWFALAFVVLAGAVWAALLSFVRPDHLRNPEGRVLPGVALGFVCSVTTVWIYVFASLSFILMTLGLVTYTFSASPENALPSLFDAYLWYMLDLIPSLKVNAALGWTPEVDLNGGWRGFLLLLFRIVIVFQLFAIWRALIKERSPRPVAAAVPES
jgi:hypothetical protein